MFTVMSTLVACKGEEGAASDAKSGASAAAPAPASTDEPDGYAKASVANKVTLADFKSYLGSVSTVTLGRESKDGKFDVLEWPMQQPGMAGYANYRTVFGEFASHAEVKAAYKDAYGGLKGAVGCAKFEVGARRLIATIMLEGTQSSGGPVVPCTASFSGIL
jgi:hypothetical protein